MLMEMITKERKSGDVRERGENCSSMCVGRLGMEDGTQYTREGVHLRLQPGHKKQGDEREGRMRGDRRRRLHQFADVLYEYGHSCPSVVSQ